MALRGFYDLLQRKVQYIGSDVSNDDMALRGLTYILLQRRTIQYIGSNMSMVG